MKDYRYDYLLCHGGVCSGSDRFLTEGLSDVNGWLAANPGEVIILYVEDHSGAASTKLYDRFASAGIANKIYPSGGCNAIPSDLTHADVLGAGKQVVLWKDGRDGTPACYEGVDSRFSNLSHTGLGDLSRVWEDATIIGAIFDNAGDGRIDATDVANYVASGINIINLDDMSPSDGRNEKILWSWNNGEPNNVNNEDCALQIGSSASGRWNDANCSSAAAHACQDIVTGAWALGSQTSAWINGPVACAALGGNYRFSAPVNPATNAALKAVAGGQNVWIAMNDRGIEGDWTAPSFEYRHLQDGRSNHCMIIAGGAVAGNPLKSGVCSQQYNNDKWIHEQVSGLLRSQGGNLCASTDGNNAVADKLKARPCNANDTNQQFELIGTTLRPVNNPNVSLYTFSPELGAEVGLWGNSTESHQQWKFGGKGIGNGIDVPTIALQYTLASGAQRLWTDSGSGANNDGSIWRLNSLSGFYPLGDIPMSGYSFSSGIEKVLVKDGQPGVARPTGYQWIWNDSGSGASVDLSIWRPIAPEGFVCLGDVVTTNHGAAPSTDLIRCVGEYYVEQAASNNWAWNDSGSGGDYDVSWWYGYNGNGAALNAGALRTSRNYSAPSADLVKLISKSKAQQVTVTNFAFNKPAEQSTTGWGGVASRAVDGNTNGSWGASSVTHTNSSNQSWWQVDLGAIENIDSVEVFNRTDCCTSRLSNFYVFVSETPFSSRSMSDLVNDSSVYSHYYSGASPSQVQIPVGANGRYVRVQLAGTNYLSLAEVKVMGVGL